MMGNKVFPKRQRLPSVRLDDIGDQPAALPSELSLRKKTQIENGAFLQYYPANSDVVDSVFVPLRLDMLPKARPVFYGSECMIPQQNSSSFDEEEQSHDLRAGSKPSHKSLVRQNVPDFQANSMAGNDGRILQAGLKFHSDCSRSRKRRSGSLKRLPPIEKLRRVILSVNHRDENENKNENEKASHLDGIPDVPSNEANSNDVPEDFKESHSHASEAFTNSTETSKLLADDRVREAILSKEVLVHENAQESSLHVCIERKMLNEENTIGEDRERSADVHASPIIDTPRVVFAPLENKKLKGMAQLNVKQLPANMRPLSEAKMCLKDSGTLSDSEDNQGELQSMDVRQLGNCMNAVNGWLTDLGLGKYGPLFEAHEVDKEVLPFLTWDDLKEMGISAVGTRRKIFCAIEGLRGLDAF